VLTRNRELIANIDGKRPIESYEFVVLDTELTGLNPSTDEIISIGAVRIRELRIAVGENFFCYVRPAGAMPKDSTLVHQITPDQIENAPGLAEVLPEFVEFCGQAVIVGHFVQLDLGFLNRATKKVLGGVLVNPALDTMKLAQAYHGYQQDAHFDGAYTRVSLNLTHLAQRYGLPLFAKHDALEDALQTAYLFLFLTRRLRNYGFQTLRDMHRACRSNPIG
jgi:DNA polymerase III subunit epsilon